jgi:hypothetical protein
VGIDVDANGAVYLVDYYPPFVRVFDSTGRVRFTFGEEGEGPGQFRRPMRVYANLDGSVIVHDYQPQRLTILDADGNLSTTLSIPISGLVSNTDYDPWRAEYYIATWSQRSLIPRIHRWSLRTGEVSTLVDDDHVFPRARNNRDVLDSYFGFAVSPTRTFAIGDRWWAYNVDVFSWDGSLMGSIIRDVPRPARSTVEMEQARQRAKQMEQQGLGYQEPHGERPHFDQWALEYDDLERLWVRTQRRVDDSTVFDVFAADRTYMGEVVLPVAVKQTAQSFAASSEYLAVVYGDDVGTEFVGLWRVVEDPATGTERSW